MERRQYRNPPIHEAICEFHFVKTDEWDLTLPGRFHERIKGEYSAKPREIKGLGLQITDEVGPATVQVRKSRVKVQFPTEDNKRLIGIGPDLLSVVVRNPYPGWEKFRQQIEAGLNVYKEIVNPSGVVRIGIRYINHIHISIKGKPIDLDDYFNHAPTTPDELPLSMYNVVSRIESNVIDAPIRLFITFASTTAPEGRLGFLLDLDIVWLAEGEEFLPPNEVMTMVDDLRDRERVAFESLITDRCREIFDAEN